MKKKHLVLNPKLLVKKEMISSLTEQESTRINGGGTFRTECYSGCLQTCTPTCMLEPVSVNCPSYACPVGTLIGTSC